MVHSSFEIKTDRPCFAIHVLTKERIRKHRAIMEEVGTSSSVTLAINTCGSAESFKRSFSLQFTEASRLGIIGRHRGSLTLKRKQGMKYFLLDPEVAGHFGKNCVVDLSKRPPIVTGFHNEFDGWLGDDLLERISTF